MSIIKAVVIGVSLKSEPEEQIDEYLDELVFLAETADVEVIKRFKQKLNHIDSKYFLGRGKILEIADFVKKNEIELAIFDEELSPAQMKNLNRDLNIQIMDRTSLILDIFVLRANTAIAKKQVELAQYQYLLPHLSGMWQHLERQRGGIGMRGPGEKEIETDRRVIKERIAKLREDIEKIDVQKRVQRKGRGKLVRVALVGYTNVGKSTLMNLLSKTNVLAENKLFATLDTTVRKVAIGNVPFLLTDTVGFIRKLPHTLVEAFKSTLDEVREADVIMHIVDVSHPLFDEQIEIVNRTLFEIGAVDKAVLMVFNKIDQFKYIPKDEFDLTPMKKENYSLEDLKKMWMSKGDLKAVYISAKQKINIEELRKILYEEVKKVHQMRYPYDDLFYPDDFNIKEV